MTASRPKRNYKDSLFRQYFEKPTYLAGFHERITGIPTAPKDITITTIKNIMFSSQKNDISFLAGDRFMVLTEHQSSLNENMPLRMLLYVAMLYYKRVKRKALYREHLIPLPVPEFYEFSLADPHLPLIQKLRLSEAFPKNIPFEAPLELIVTRLNISYNEDKDKRSELLKYKPICDYSFFVHKSKVLKASGLPLKEAIQQTTDFCINHNIMKDFLLEHYEEVFDMYSIQWNEHDYGAAMKADGRIEGRNEMATDTALKMLSCNEPIEKIVTYTNLSPEKIAELAQQLH
ncbi:hypothetical protein SELR_05950 [Selenomonas ruminantium subsp. lactilytica TAM6421]|uniref:Transposase (putative) YhgA-like domain-containing protein n=1 Tax=Selenomonas ruminantium subsp. lactilytica (strain NBRC 103574 / TAM6421) TaxID=927704 RepID=I0GNG6_SELRL|nr:hypothetical protein [Selenomonas ruminantium]BAL82303.1 hypothetical protein SELR_05950 [Selenomonas ruminantium subsp. lactilytica TAM6421]